MKGYASLIFFCPPVKYYRNIRRIHYCNYVKRLHIFIEYQPVYHLSLYIIKAHAIQFFVTIRKVRHISVSILANKKHIMSKQFKDFNALISSAGNYPEFNLFFSTATVGGYK
jgi:hypothetical protein